MAMMAMAMTIRMMTDDDDGTEEVRPPRPPRPPRPTRPPRPPPRSCSRRRKAPIRPRIFFVLIPLSCTFPFFRCASWQCCLL